jgi:hypothetical protein
VNRPSPIQPLSALVDRTLTVAHIGAPKLWTVGPSERAADAADAMTARGFDVAGVTAAPVTHFVQLAELKRAGAQKAHKCALPIPASMCVEKSLPLTQLFRRLQESEFAFVLDGDEVSTVVTRADLQAPAIGVVVLAYLTVIESGLRTLVMAKAGDSFFDLLPASRQKVVEELFEQKSRQNVATGFEDCLYFSDWLTCSKKAGVWERLGFRSANSFADETGSYSGVRNNLAHGGTILDGDVDALAALERVDRIRRFAEQLWRVVDSLDDSWDDYAATVISWPKCRGVLAGPGAVAKLSGAVPQHVLTAWNPESVRRSRDVNRAANTRLRELLRRHGPRPKVVVGESPDGRWREESYLAVGLTRERAVEVAEMFGQRAIFELTQDAVHVVRCSDSLVIRSVARRR